MILMDVLQVLPEVIQITLAIRPPPIKIRMDRLGARHRRPQTTLGHRTLSITATTPMMTSGRGKYIGRNNKRCVIAPFCYC